MLLRMPDKGENMTVKENLGLKNAPDSKEIKELNSLIAESLEVLEKKNLSMIIHGGSLPSKTNQDTGFGSLNSAGAREFVDFISSYGFNSIQLGPDGKTKSSDASPYIGTMFSTNPLFIDLYELTTDEWAKLLSQETFNKIVEQNPAKNTSRTAYSYIYNTQNEGLKEVYNNFKAILKDKKNPFNKLVNSLDKKFSGFKKENADWLDKDALYEALSVKHNNDYWHSWSDELDKGLFSSAYKGSKEAKQRISEIEKTYTDEIDFYRFCQFIANEQKEKTKKYTMKHNIKTMADIQVAFSDRDYWANQSLFLQDYFLGCPPDFFSKDGQAWGFPILDPEKIYNPNGSIGEAGKLLKERFSKVFKENAGGARIDHAVGLVDPWVYKAGRSAKPEDGGIRLYTAPDSEVFSKYSVISMSDLNTYRDINVNIHEANIREDQLDDILPPENEQRVKISSLEKKEVLDKFSGIVKIILQAAEENGVDKESIIFEDLGTVTNPVVMVLDKLGLCGIRVTQFVDPKEPEHVYRGKNVKKRHWITVGTHDNLPISMLTRDWYNDRELIEQHISYMADDIISDNNQEKKNQFMDKLRHSQEEFIKAKFIELFISPSENIQIFFTDFFGMDEAYNKPGTSGSENWSLRLPANFEEVYYQNLLYNKALNLPEILKASI